MSLIHCILCIFLLASSLAFPRDAELIPSSIPRSDSNKPPPSDPGIFIVNLRPFSSRSLIERLFGGSFPFVPQIRIPSNRNPGAFDRDQPSFFQDFDALFPDIPSFPDFSVFRDRRFPDFSSLPDDYKNTTRDVKVINGTKIEVNQTTTKHKDDKGVVFYQVETVRLTPDGVERRGGSGTALGGGGDEIGFGLPDVRPFRTNRVPAEPFRNSGKFPLVLQESISAEPYRILRNRRSTQQNRLYYRSSKNVTKKFSGPRDYQGGSGIGHPGKKSFGVNAQAIISPQTQSLLNDTMVNYIFPMRPLNPDAELIDISNLIEERKQSTPSIQTSHDPEQSGSGSLRQLNSRGAPHSSSQTAGSSELPRLRSPKYTNPQNRISALHSNHYSPSIIQSSSRPRYHYYYYNNIRENSSITRPSLRRLVKHGPLSYNRLHPYMQ